MFFVWWRQLVFTGFRIFPGSRYSKYPRWPVLRCFSPVIGHVVDELLDIRLLTWNTSSFQFGLVRFRSHPTLHHLGESAGLHVSEERKKDQSKKDWPGLSSQWLLHDTSLLGRSPRRAATGKGKPMTPIFTINSSTNLKISLKCKYVLWNISPTAGADQVLSVWSQQIQLSAKLEFLISW